MQRAWRQKDEAGREHAASWWREGQPQLLGGTQQPRPCLRLCRLANMGRRGGGAQVQALVPCRRTRGRGARHHRQD